MTEMQDFESRLAEHLRAYAAPAARPARREAVATAVAAGRETRRGALGRLRWPAIPRLSNLVVAGAVAVVIVVTGALGLSFFFLNQDGIAGPATTSTPAPSGTAAASAVPTAVVSPVPSPAPETFQPRRDGEFIMFESLGAARGWDLAAQDPATGKLRKLVQTNVIVDCPDRVRCLNFVRKAEWSADGRWVAFEVSNASLDGPPLGPCAPAVGLWIQGPSGAPRQLTTPCDAPPASDQAVEELWEWSPVDARLAYVRIDGETDELLVIDPSDGARTSLVTDNVDAPYPVESDSVVWSPDGSRIAYVDANSVYSVEVEGGERSLLADTFEEIIDMAWSPDGTQILVLDRGRYRLQVMDADGSDLRVLQEGEDACCDMAWSPNGDRILYLLSLLRPGQPDWGRGYSELWNVAADGSNAIQIFGQDDCDDGNIDEAPVWSPDGLQVAYNAPGCGNWVVESADGTTDVERISELVWRSWYSSGLTGRDLARIGHIDH